MLWSSPFQGEPERRANRVRWDSLKRRYPRIIEGDIPAIVRLVEEDNEDEILFYASSSTELRNNSPRHRPIDILANSRHLLRYYREFLSLGVDITQLAITVLRAGDDDLMDRLVESGACRNRLAEEACLLGKEQQARRMRFPYSHGAHSAAEGGHWNLVLDFLDPRELYYGAAISSIAAIAARTGREDYLRKMIAFGARNYDSYAAEAAGGGHKDIVDEMIARGANDINGIAWEAAGGHKDIVDDTIARGADDFNQIAKRAAREGYKKIVLDMIERGANNFNQIALDASREGYKDIVDMVQLNLTKPREVITETLRGGYNDIALSLFSLVRDR